MSHSYVRHDSFISVTELIHMCDMTHSYVWHNSFMCVTWLIHMRDMTHLYVWQDSFICVTWVIHMCDMIARPTYRVAKIIGCLKLQCLCAKEPLIIAIQGATMIGRSSDALSCRCLSAKEPLIIGLFCRKWPTKTRHPMGLGHPIELRIPYMYHATCRICICKNPLIPVRWLPHNRKNFLWKIKPPKWYKQT